MEYSKDINYKGATFNVTVRPEQIGNSFSYKIETDGLERVLRSDDEAGFRPGEIGGPKGRPNNDAPTWHDYHSEEDAMFAGKEYAAYLERKAERLSKEQ